MSKQVSKLSKEKKKLNKIIEELEKSKNEINLELAKNKEDKKQILELQIKENKKINILSKEKEKYKKERNSIKEELDQMKIRLSLIEQENQKLSTLNNKLEQELKLRPKINRPPSAKKEEQKKATAQMNLNQEKQNEFSMLSNSGYFGGADELLNTLCEYCVKNNINLKKHLKRYDIAKNGRIGENDFKKAIEELKLGFISLDLDKLANACKSPHDNNIAIDNFLNILKNKNQNFKNYMENLSEVPDNIDPESKHFSRKYDNFENKAFNIDY